MDEYDKLITLKNYADLAGHRLQLFQKLSYSPYKANFRCGICGDSAKNKYKKRGYILEKSNNLLYHCHNGCGSMSFEHFLKQHHEDLYNQFRMDTLIKKPVHVDEFQETLSKSTFRFKPKPLDSVYNFNKSHPARQYLNKRKITFQDILYVNKFHKYVMGWLPGYKARTVDYPRIIIPLRDYDGTLMGVSARSMSDKDSPKYLTLKKPGSKKVFGLDRVDITQDVRVLEGAFDAMFVHNSIALLGTDGDLSQCNIQKDRLVFVFDNQPRNPQVIHKYEQIIQSGYRIVIWPSYIIEKDINELIENEISEEIIEEMIIKNTYSGIDAKIRLTNWRKI